MSGIGLCLPNHYASQKLWLADESQNSFLCGIIDTHRTFGSIRTSHLSGARCQREAWIEMFNI